jgi:predicted RecA/RadA family phage recombinase
VATVNKNFRVKNGLVVEGSTATVNGYDILTKSSADESYIIDLIGGQATSANTANTVVKRDGLGNFSAGTITANLTGDVTGTVSSLSNHNTDDLSEGSNLYFTNQRALDATSAAYDAAGAASAAAGSAQAAAETYADNLVNGLDTDDIEEGSSNLYFTNGRARNAMAAGTGLSYDSSTGTFSVTANTYDAWGSASAAEAAANSYTDDEINALTTTDIEEGTNLYYTDTRARGAVSAGSGLSYNGGTGEFSVDTSVIANKSYVDTAITNLVDGAPGLLDTLNEIAAAINDDANYFTTIANNLAGKLDLAGGTLTGALTLHADPSNALHAATKQYVDAAESAAQSAAESTAQAALDDVLDGTTDFTAIDVNSVSRQIAATTGNIVTAASTTAISWNKTDYRSAKILVKAKNGSHTHISEIIVTLDTSDNIALNEYGITTTNGSLMTIDADINSGNVRLLVTPAHNNTEVMAHATLLA